MPLPAEPLPEGFDPDGYLDSLEPVGWRLGLDRMWKLTTALGLPQRRFASVHVVGTNGKSSVTRMVAALLEAHGVTSGACLSPHTSPLDRAHADPRRGDRAAGLGRSGGPGRGRRRGRSTARSTTARR